MITDVKPYPAMKDSGVEWRPNTAHAGWSPRGTIVGRRKVVIRKPDGTKTGGNKLCQTAGKLRDDHPWP